MFLKKAFGWTVFIVMLSFFVAPLVFADSKKTTEDNNAYNSTKSYSADNTIRIRTYTQGDNNSIKISGFQERFSEWVTNVFDSNNGLSITSSYKTGLPIVDTINSSIEHPQSGRALRLKITPFYVQNGNRTVWYANWQDVDANYFYDLGDFSATEIITVLTNNYLSLGSFPANVLRRDFHIEALVEPVCTAPTGYTGQSDAYYTSTHSSDDSNYIYLDHPRPATGGNGTVELTCSNNYSVAKNIMSCDQGYKLVGTTSTGTCDVCSDYDSTSYTGGDTLTHTCCDNSNEIYYGGSCQATKEFKFKINVKDTSNASLNGVSVSACKGATCTDYAVIGTTTNGETIFDQTGLDSILPSVYKLGCTISTGTSNKEITCKMANGDTIDDINFKFTKSGYDDLLKPALVSNTDSYTSLNTYTVQMTKFKTFEFGGDVQGVDGTLFSRIEVYACTATDCSSYPTDFSKIGDTLNGKMIFGNTLLLSPLALYEEGCIKEIEAAGNYDKVVCSTSGTSSVDITLRFVDPLGTYVAEEVLLPGVYLEEIFNNLNIKMSKFDTFEFSGVVKDENTSAFVGGVEVYVCDNSINVNADCEPTDLIGTTATDGKIVFDLSIFTAPIDLACSVSGTGSFSCTADSGKTVNLRFKFSKAGYYPVYKTDNELGIDSDVLIDPVNTFELQGKVLDSSGGGYYGATVYGCIKGSSCHDYDTTPADWINLGTTESNGKLNFSSIAGTGTTDLTTPADTFFASTGTCSIADLDLLGGADKYKTLKCDLPETTTVVSMKLWVVPVGHAYETMKQYPITFSDTNSDSVYDYVIGDSTHLNVGTSMPFEVKLVEKNYFQLKGNVYGGACGTTISPSTHIKIKVCDNSLNTCDDTDLSAVSWEEIGGINSSGEITFTDTNANDVPDFTAVAGYNGIFSGWLCELQSSDTVLKCIPPNSSDVIGKNLRFVAVDTRDNPGAKYNPGFKDGKVITSGNNINDWSTCPTIQSTPNDPIVMTEKDLCSYTLDLDGDGDFTNDASLEMRRYKDDASGTYSNYPIWTWKESVGNCTRATYFKISSVDSSDVCMVPADGATTASTCGSVNTPNLFVLNNNDGTFQYRNKNEYDTNISTLTLYAVPCENGTTGSCSTDIAKQFSLAASSSDLLCGNGAQDDYYDFTTNFTTETAAAGSEQCDKVSSLFIDGCANTCEFNTIPTSQNCPTNTIIGFSNTTPATALTTGYLSSNTTYDTTCSVWDWANNTGCSAWGTAPDWSWYDSECDGSFASCSSAEEAALSAITAVPTACFFQCKKTSGYHGQDSDADGTIDSCAPFSVCGDGYTHTVSPSEACDGGSYCTSSCTLGTKTILCSNKFTLPSNAGWCASPGDKVVVNCTNPDSCDYSPSDLNKTNDSCPTTTPYTNECHFECDSSYTYNTTSETCETTIPRGDVIVASPTAGGMNFKLSVDGNKDKWSSDDGTKKYVQSISNAGVDLDEVEMKFRIELGNVNPTVTDSDGIGKVLVRWKIAGIDTDGNKKFLHSTEECLAINDLACRGTCTGGATISGSSLCEVDFVTGDAGTYSEITLLDSSTAGNIYGVNGDNEHQSLIDFLTKGGGVGVDAALLYPRIEFSFGEVPIWGGSDFPDIMYKIRFGLSKAISELSLDNITVPNEIIKITSEGISEGVKQSIQMKVSPRALAPVFDYAVSN